MGKSIAPIKGMPDLVPEHSASWHFAEKIIQQVLQSYGYDELRTPMLEKTELFKRSIGDETDIVSKEMFTFESRSGTSLTLRPEATASCVRAGISNGLLHNQRRRIYYYGPMFRYERPQKGRYRQFYQVGAEAFGLPGPDIDAEIILMLARIFKELGLQDLTLKVNCLGSSDGREQYANALREYLKTSIEQLDEDSVRRLDKNPLRILDSKNESMQSLINQAPRMSEYLSAAEQAHYQGILKRLDAVGLVYEQEPRLVRGLDYYTGLVFEWQTSQLGAQNAICGGGRYDHLVEQLGGKATPAVGWAMGMERLIALLALDDATIPAAPVMAYFVTPGEQAALAAVPLIESLRDEYPDFRILAHGASGSLKSQLKAADKSGAVLALILGETELAAQEVALKSMLDGKQQAVAWQQLAGALAFELGRGVDD